MSKMSSAIIGSYNHERYVLSAIASIASQVDEVIVVDDASTDSTWQILSDATKVYSNLRIHKNSGNLGVSATYNRLIDLANGHYLVFQSADDLSKPGRVTRQISLLENNSVGCVTSVPEIINTDGLVLDLLAAPEFIDKIKPSDMAARLLLEGNFICSGTATMLSSTAEHIGAFQDGLVHLQDWDFWLRYFDSEQMIIDPVPVLSYRKHKSNLSGGHHDLYSTKNAEMLYEKNKIVGRYLESLDEKRMNQILKFKFGIVLPYVSQSTKLWLIKSLVR